MGPLIAGLIVLAMIAINYWAIAAGDGQYTALYNAASIAGGLGLLSLLMYFIVAVYAVVSLTGPWAGKVIIGMQCAVGALTMTSLGLAVLIVVRKRSM